MREHESDIPDILRWIGREALIDPDSDIWSDTKFLDWLRNRPPAGDDSGIAVGEPAGMTRSERRLMNRILASAAGIERVESAPDLLTAAERVEGSRNTRSVRAAPRLDQRVAAGVGRELWDEIAEEWIPLPENQRRGEFVALRIAGESMTPLVHPGDTVLVRLAGKAEQGNVIVARDPANGYVCKRVVRSTRREIVLGSLAPGYEPVVIPNDPKLVLGTVVMIWCEHRE